MGTITKPAPAAKIDLAKLTTDLIEAQRLALKAANASDDGGTCNMDGMYLRMARVKEDKAEAAINAAGLRGHKMRHSWFGVGYLINPNVPGQGNKRMYGAEAMTNYMRRAGYDVSDWSQMD